jgi:ATP-dependent exoDNAse (exonuclease V) beta subunit
MSLLTEEGRIVGTAVHHWLERMAADGAVGWNRERLAALQPRLCAWLAGEGIPQGRLTACAERAQLALGRTLDSPRGRWLLQAHPEAASELALTGVIDGLPVHAVIDRTFVDEDGVRWVIDYKTSEPVGGERLEDFLARETERYRSQLQVYLDLLKQARSDGRSLRAALYFPLIDGWSEWG